MAEIFTVHWIFMSSATLPSTSPSCWGWAMWLVLANGLWMKVIHITSRLKYWRAIAWQSNSIFCFQKHYQDVQQPPSLSQGQEGKCLRELRGFSWIRNKPLYVKPLRFWNVFTTAAQPSLTNATRQPEAPTAQWDAKLEIKDTSPILR